MAATDIKVLKSSRVFAPINRLIDSLPDLPWSVIDYGVKCIFIKMRRFGFSGLILGRQRILKKRV